MTAITKPSRFWGTTPRRIKWLVNILLVLLSAAVVAIGLFLFRDFIWKYSATYFANEAGWAKAKYYYAHNSPRLLQLEMINVSDWQDKGAVPNLYEMRPAGRQQDGFDIYLFYVDSSGGGAQRITGASYVEGFNRGMRFMCAHPDRFGPDGERLPGSTDTNRPPSKQVAVNPA